MNEAPQTELVCIQCVYHMRTYIAGLCSRVNIRLFISSQNIIQIYDQGEPAVSYKWAGWVWEITGWSSRLLENYDHVKGIYRIYPNSIKENRRMSICNRLDLQTGGSQPVVPKNLHGHWFKSITMFCGTDNIMWDSPTFSLNDGIFCKILSLPLNIVIDLNNVMLRYWKENKFKKFQVTNNTLNFEVYRATMDDATPHFILYLVSPIMFVLLNTHFKLPMLCHQH